MKKTNLILLMSVIATTIFGVSIFSACNKKTTCSSVACRNNGVCINSKCSCPVGYIGDFCETGVTSYVTYKNNTFTPITMTVTNGATSVLAVGKSMTVQGTFGTAVVGTATTSGSASSLGIDIPGGSIGVIINWQLNNAFSSKAKDTTNQSLDVPASYYFLRMANRTGVNVIHYTANTSGIDSLGQDITVPNTGLTYDLGYYLAKPNNGTNVQTILSSGKIQLSTITLPYTTDQTATLTLN